MFEGVRPARDRYARDQAMAMDARPGRRARASSVASMYPETAARWAMDEARVGHVFSVPTASERKQHPPSRMAFDSARNRGDAASLERTFGTAFAARLEEIKTVR